MTLNEITTLIASQFKREMDQPFKEMLAKRVAYWRSRLIKDSIDKDVRERKFFKQTIFVTMTKLNEVLCDVPYTQCKVAWTASKVPKPLRANGILFDYVGAINGMTPFKNAEPGIIPYMMQGKYSGKVIYYTYENEYVKVYGNSKIPKIRIDDVFDDPEAAAALNCLSGNGCNFWDEEYPCTGDIMQRIVQYILQVDFNLKPAEGTTEIPVAQEPVQA